MKKAALVSAIFLFAPAISFAAPLTQAQAESLINVVQSSPSTPASAFTNLITVFSNITATQAESLIGVVQAAPGASTKAFVSLLTSFTVDTSVAKTATADTPSVQPIQVSPQTTQFGTASAGCIPNPTLTLSVATSSLDRVNDWNIYRQVAFSAVYRTGCPIDAKATTYVYDAKTGDGRVSGTEITDHGTLNSSEGHFGAYSTDWNSAENAYMTEIISVKDIRLQTALPYKYLGTNPVASGILPLHFSLTVGSTTQTVDVP